MLSGFRSFITVDENVIHHAILNTCLYGTEYLLESDEKILRRDFEKGRHQAPWKSRIDQWFDTNPKIDKSNLLGNDVGQTANINQEVLNRTLSGANGYESYVVHLTPAAQSGFITCPLASGGCKATCLQTAGNIGALSDKTSARLRRTWFLAKEMPYVLSNMVKQISRLRNEAAERGNKLVIRLNGTSDLHWEDMKDEQGKSLMDQLPDVVFYDYTKIPTRMGETPPNYHLTFSRSENNEAESVELLKKGFNVAVVFGPGKVHNQEDAGPNLKYPDGRRLLPVVWNGFKVISGDDHDLRFLEQQPNEGKGTHKGLVIGLIAKGAAAFESYSSSENKFLNKSGFIVQPSDPSITRYRENAEFIKIANELINARNNSEDNALGNFSKRKAKYLDEQRVIAGLLTGNLSAEEKEKLAKEPRYKKLMDRFAQINDYCKKYPSMCRRDYLSAAGKKHSTSHFDVAGEPTFSPMPFDPNKLKAMGLISGKKKDMQQPDERENEFKAWLAAREKEAVPPSAPPRLPLV